MEWIRTANLEKYNVVEAFNTFESLDWIKSGLRLQKEI